MAEGHAPGHVSGGVLPPLTSSLIEDPAKDVQVPKHISTKTCGRNKPQNEFSLDGKNVESRIVQKVVVKSDDTSKIIDNIKGHHQVCGPMCESTVNVVETSVSSSFSLRGDLCFCSGGKGP